MKASKTLTNAAGFYAQKHVVKRARKSLSFVDSVFCNVVGGIYLDGAELGPDEAAALRIVLAQAAYGFGGSAPPCHTLGNILFHIDSGLAPMDYSVVRKLARGAYDFDESALPEEDFVIAWIGERYISLDKLLEIDDAWGL